LLALPPVVRGQAVAGVDPGFALAVGTVGADALGRTVAVTVGDAEGLTVGLAVREADGIGGAVGDEAASG